jgi:hypothetical protein
MTDIHEIERLIPDGEQVYVYACFMPARKTNIIIKPGSQIVDAPSPFSYKTFYFYPRIKSLPNLLKAVKKVDVKKEFNREQTLFADFKPDSKTLFRKCFEYDMKFSKLNRLIKDSKEVINIS